MSANSSLGDSVCKMSTIALGEFSFGMKYGKEDEGEIIATDITPCNKVFTRSKLLCNREKNQDKK
jgi:hypothetical protein